MTGKKRLEHELVDMQDRWIRLSAFIHTDKFRDIGERQRELLMQQKEVQERYIEILKERLRLWMD